MIETLRPRQEAETGPEIERIELENDLVFLGRSGTGKTTIVELLRQDAGLLKTNVTYTGELIRRITGNISGGFMDRDPEVDRMVDANQVDWILSALELDKLDKTDERLNIKRRILEGRLAGVLLRQIRQVYPNIPVRSVMLVAPLKIRMERLYRKRNAKQDRIIADAERELDKAIIAGAKPEKISSLLERITQLKMEEITPKSVEIAEKDREKKDLLHWRLVHPEIDFDPFNPELKGIYDYVIHTGRKANGEIKTPQEVVAEIKRKLMAGGDAHPVRRHRSGIIIPGHGFGEKRIKEPKTNGVNN